MSTFAVKETFEAEAKSQEELAQAQQAQSKLEEVAGEPKPIIEINGTTLPAETRTLRDKERAVPFTFLVIDTPDKWLAASNFTTDYTLASPNSSQALKFKCRPFSLQEWEEVENSIPMPEPDLAASTPDADDSEKYKADKQLVLDKRKAFFLEAGTGIKIPGNSLEEKVGWLNKKGQGEIDALYDYLTDELSALRDGSFLDLFNSISLTAERVVTEVTTFEDWADASDIQLVCRMQRPGDRYIMEFPLRGISASDKRKLDEANKTPMPPKIPGRTADGRLDPTRLVDNWNDYTYRQQVRAYTRKELVMLLEAVLPFEIPGTTIETKYDWLGQRVIGDVLKLRNFVNNGIIKYRRHFESFI